MKTTFKNLAAQAEKLRRHNRQGSYKTKERYYEAFLRFLRFTAERFHLEKLANLSGKHMTAYVADMQRRGLSPATIKTELSAIRFWHDQIPNARYTLPDNRELALERRIFGKQDRTWSYREFNFMIGECWKANRKDFEACIVIGRYAGLRIHEVMRMDTAIARAAFHDGFLTIKGKGGKVREVPINETIRIELAALLKITPPGHKLFVPAGWDTHSVIHELEAFIRQHRDAVKDEGSERPMTFHGLRHTCAADWYRRLTREGKTPHEACRQVSRWLGHERGRSRGFIWLARRASRTATGTAVTAMLNRYGDVLTVKEVCTILRIGRNKAYKLLEKKQIAYIRIGRTYRIPKESLLAYLHIQETNEVALPRQVGYNKSG